MAQRAGYIELSVRIAKEGDQWEARCPELGTAACGDTLDEAAAAIRDMVALHLNSLTQMGICEDFLKKHGITFHRGAPPRRARRRELSAEQDEYVTPLIERLPCAV
ncbi:MAG: type II toxin-antitoxin system HicB family antitoxin [Planctomycetota bacterium]